VNLRTALALILVAVAVPLAAQQHPNVARGFSPDKVFHFDGIDSINLFNGNLNAAVPLGQQFSVGGKLSYGFSLSYAGNAWEHADREEYLFSVDGEVITTNYTWTFPSRRDNAGLGWIFSLGGSLITSDVSGCVSGSDINPYSPDPMTAYESPDGATHCLYFRQIDAGNAPVQSGWYYSHDGSYLRYNSTTGRLESPDGTMRDFDSNGRLIRMSDRFGNHVDVNYIDSDASNPVQAGAPTWVVTDSATPPRTHYVYFKSTAPYAEVIDTTTVAHTSVAEVHFASGLVYKFHYEGESGSWATVNRPVILGTDPGTLAHTTLATLLTDVEATSGTTEYLRYSFVNDHGGTSDPAPAWSGALTKITLPTGGIIEYDYGSFILPSARNSTIASRKYSFGPSGPFGTPASVIERRLKAAGGGLLGRRTIEDAADPTALTKVVLRTVTERDAEQRILQQVVHYFSVCVYTNSNCSVPGEYGLPLRRDSVLTTPGGDRYLSAEHYGFNGMNQWTVLRKDYVRYEADNALEAVASASADENRRLSAETTTYEDDGGKFADTAHYDFDGVGHYRQTVTSGFTATDPTRTSKTNFNGTLGTLNPIPAGATSVSGYTFWPTNSPWLTETYTYRTLTESDTASTIESFSCFDSLTGALNGQRTLVASPSDPANPPLNGTDLLVLYGYDANGNLISERYAGGDPAPDGSSVPAPTTSACGSMSSDRYRISHTYTNGVVATSQYLDGAGSPLSFKSVDRTIDSVTGLPTSSRVAATATDNGFSTSYEYDPLGRLTWSKPATGAWANLVYAISPPAVDVYAYENGNPNGSPGPLIRHDSFGYDSLGRLNSETKPLPTGTTTRRTLYDSLGRKTTVSEWEPSPQNWTAFEYDAFGRPTRVTAPDASVLTMSYTGVSTSRKTVAVRTGGDALTFTTTDSITTETSDRNGHLVSVVEGGLSGFETGYSYDVAGHLTQVCMPKGDCTQSRTFNYDNRGFLTAESHPEKGATGGGTTTYKYDARGHVVQRTDGTASGPFDITFIFDRAERPTTVRETRLTNGVNRILKMFDYAASNNGTDYANGRVRNATRFNWFDTMGKNVQVVENYVYSGSGARASSRTTSEFECTTTNNPCNSAPTGTPLRQFTTSLAYDDLGDVKSLNYPICGVGCGSLPQSAPTITNAFTGGMLTAVSFPFGDTKQNTIAYSSNSMPYMITHFNGVVDYQEPDLHSMPRPLKIETTGARDVSPCTAPTVLSGPVARTVAPGTQVTLTAQLSGDDDTTNHPMSLQWHFLSNGTDTLIAGQTASSYTFTAQTTATYWLVASSNCGTATTNRATVSVCAAPVVTVTWTPPVQGKTRITAGQFADVAVAASGSGLTYQWYEGATTDKSRPVYGGVTASIRVYPGASTSYWVLVANDCSSVNSQSVTVPVDAALTPPSGLVARSNGYSVTLTWNGASPSARVAGYQIQRWEPGHYYYDYGQTTQTTATDNSVVALNAYVYRVYATDTNGATTLMTDPDNTVVMSYANNPLHGTSIHGRDFSEMRQAIDAYRRLANLPPIWSSYLPLTGPVLLSDISDLRFYLDDVRYRLRLPPMTYSNSPPAYVSASDVLELRRGVQ